MTTTTKNTTKGEDRGINPTSTYKEWLTTQEALRHCMSKPKESDESEMDSMPFVWADAGMDCMIQGDVNTSVYEFTGGVGVDDLGVCAVTKRRYVTKTGQTRGMADETFRVDSGEDAIPATTRYAPAAAHDLI